MSEKSEEDIEWDGHLRRIQLWDYLQWRLWSGQPRTMRDIAEATGRDHGTIKKTEQRALLKLRKATERKDRAKLIASLRRKANLDTDG